MKFWKYLGYFLIFSWLLDWLDHSSTDTDSSFGNHFDDDDPFDPLNDLY